MPGSGPDAISGNSSPTMDVPIKPLLSIWDDLALGFSNQQRLYIACVNLFFNREDSI
jgi:hypothetical protein